MGNCSSADSAEVVATAKLVLQDGTLQEFSYPVKVSYLLGENPTCFICNSDQMDFDDVVTAVDEDEVLQPGQLYFVLPLNRLRQPLQPAEMAALAVKASSALMKSAAATSDKYGYRRKQIVITAQPDYKSLRSVSAAAGGGAAVSSRRSRRASSRSGGKEKFAALLTSIPE
ncbi:hypothetical protein HN51_068542 [Arachis hypogaea]|uniref:Uncharacterized protein n=2 Tax=Arachis TaxID=3817 RepID=A0A444Z9Y6_ARAHY|nr:uncharacterized protein LOC107487908 [Arachis duranensis]XP_016201783.1 uncharacterized protein LOC107642820 [Arachis ipaensis]XP_025652874.1 uncharacterized protein LOC112748847 [Arachis hypogaea]XP_025698763.1 uncharacterized protein LOC112800633 [Arachis hypogaea]QHO10590.1 uncharacterized protein DS421_15g491020 [Arachis hypogaea]QHO40797.1 uncharacterized protein DS421_5g140230 [Arachis hypogaea]RYQ80452.1 hypothetical protein Ahy_Scaffold1g106857 [Arachis hypogaea]RYR10995.1 hypothe